MSTSQHPIERHPLEPFMPDGAELLMLGSFPPKSERWSMEFFYPNFQNDMWRIMGLIFYQNRHHFVAEGKKRFHKDAVVDFCIAKHIAIYDTATAVRRLNDNASDKFLEIVEPTDIDKLLQQMPRCRVIVTTGQKATDVICATLDCAAPQVGRSCRIAFGNRELIFYRMPSSSRAYPMSLEKKADVYRTMFTEIGLTHDKL